jgi:putative ABC transport system ATP-binding protein
MSIAMFGLSQKKQNVPAGPIVNAQRISKRYVMGSETVAALKDVSLSIEAGEFVAIMGPSGSGKSTLMNMIGTLDRPDQGELWLAGTEINRLSDDALAQLRNRTIGFVFQQFNLLPRTTALRQVMLPLLYQRVSARAAERIARQKLDEVGLSDRMHHVPTQLSGGQQQRVAIARALAADPRLILADEPTGALDTATSAEIMGLLTRLNSGGITVVLVTHEADVAAYVRRRILFRDGGIIEDRVLGHAVEPDETHHAVH